ncbi:MAG: hypothetical protein ABJN35_06010 [Erythrobacter sp.]
MQNANYRLELVGPFGLFAPDGRRIEVSSKKSIALLAMLATAPSARRTREYLRNILWENSDEKSAKDSLRRELSNLKKTLKAYGAEEVILIEIQRVSLAIDLVEVDIFQIGSSLPAHPMQASGDFLEGIDLPGAEEFEDWLREERSRVEDLFSAEAEQAKTEPPSPKEIFGGKVPTGIETLDAISLPLPPKPSLAILPFQCVNNVELNWTGAAIADQVSRIISQFPQLFVASGNSARQYADAGLPPTGIATKLGVTYIIDGSVIVDDEKIRASIALIDGSTGEQIWAGNVDGASHDLWSLQDEIARQIAPSIWSYVDLAERDRGLRRMQSPDGDYEQYWRANALFRSWKPEAVQEASEILDELAAKNTTCPWAASFAAYSHSMTYLLDFSPDREVSQRRANIYCQAALRYGGDNVEALGYCAGTIVNIGGEIERADRLITRSLQILPSFQPTLFWGGLVDLAAGKPERARERFELALRLNPASGARGQTIGGLGFSALLLRDFQTAVHLFERAEAEDPDFPMTRFGKIIAQSYIDPVKLDRLQITPEWMQQGLSMAGILRREKDRALIFRTE